MNDIATKTAEMMGWTNDGRWWIRPDGKYTYFAKPDNLGRSWNPAEDIAQAMMVAEWVAKETKQTIGIEIAPSGITSFVEDRYALFKEPAESVCRTALLAWKWHLEAVKE